MTRKLRRQTAVVVIRVLIAHRDPQHDQDKGMFSIRPGKIMRARRGLVVSLIDRPA
jgi:hypothetical protein